MEKLKVTNRVYTLEINHENIIFEVVVEKSPYGSFIEAIRIQNKNEWRDIKYPLKKELLEQVQDIATNWIKINLRDRAIRWESDIA